MCELAHALISSGKRLPLNFTITLPDFFMRWQACKYSRTTLTTVSDSALQILSSKLSSWISAGTGFNLTVSLLLYWELVTVLHSNSMVLVSRWEFKLLHCRNSEQILSYFDVNSLIFSDNSVRFILTPRHWNSGLVLSRVSLTSWGEGTSLALVYPPFSDGITIKIPHRVDVLLHRPASHPIFSHWVG